jgi:hypothetical protein
MGAELALRGATVQEIQLELIRRTRFNEFDGEKIAAILAKHRDLWRAVLLDRFGLPNYREPTLHTMQASGLIKLRDLDDNIWNADTLFVLTHTPAGAKVLAQALEDSETGAMPHVHDDRVTTDAALGEYGGEPYGMLTAWWD